MKKFNKYDIIIYSCLILAIVSLVLGGRDYFNSLQEESTIKEEVNAAIKNINPEEEEVVVKEEKEPTILKDIDKKTLLLNYLSNLNKQSKIITSDMVKTWGNYEINDITYKREVAKNYYQYIVNIKISNPKGTIPGKLNEEKTTKENPVLIVNAYLIYNPDTKESMIKYIDV